MATLKFDHSCELSECMDLLGYCPEMIKFRQKSNMYLDSMYNNNIAEITKMTVLTCGSKGEGVAKYFESDIDRFYAHKEIICACARTDPKSIACLGSSVTIFRSDPDGCFPGYTRLRLEYLGDGRYQELIESSLIHVDGQTYLRNDFPNTGRQTPLFDIFGSPLDMQRRSGPSNCVGNNVIAYDFVEGFMYDNTDYLKAWAERQRSHDWPPDHVIGAVLQTKGHVVPVSSKETQFVDSEWRICFTEAELILFKSLNEFHVKVFVLLKLISKSILQPNSDVDVISSYVLKNVIFWTAESNSASSFTKGALFQKFLDALKYLRHCVATEVLHNYIINQRNILSGRLSPDHKKQIVSKIDQLLAMHDGIFRTTKIGKTLEAMTDSKEDLKKLSERRNKAERLLLEKNKIFKGLESVWFNSKDQNQWHFKDILDQDGECKKSEDNLRDFILPDIKEIIARGEDPEEKLKNRLQDLLS